MSMPDTRTVNSVKKINNANGDLECLKAVINGVEMFVPLKTDNRHYQAIQEWVADGNKIEEAD